MPTIDIQMNDKVYTEYKTMLKLENKNLTKRKDKHMNYIYTYFSTPPKKYNIIKIYTSIYKNLYKYIPTM